MQQWDENIIKAGARPSPLSLAQTKEVQLALQEHYPEISLDVIEFITDGDADQKTSLRTLEKTDFFTQTIDRALLECQCRIAVHSAKDLPTYLPNGLTIAAITLGVDTRDALVLKEGVDLENLPPRAVIATSSEKREEAVKQLRSDVAFMDVRGTIHQRLELLEKSNIEGVVVAEAALVRLGLTHLNRVYLPGPTTPLQGQLAIVCRKEDTQIQELFSVLDSRAVHLHTGLRAPSNHEHGVKHAHFPFIKTMHLPADKPEIILALEQLPHYTHVIFTSQTAVLRLMELIETPDVLKAKTLIAVGNATHSLLIHYGLDALLPEEATAEDVCSLLATLPLENSFIFWPRSAQARPVISDYLQKHAITHTICDLYQTLPITYAEPPPLPNVTSVTFYSPSCVESFIACYNTPPAHINYHFIGPITEKKWRSYGLQNSF